MRKYTDPAIRTGARIVRKFNSPATKERGKKWVNRRMGIFKKIRHSI